VIKLIPKTANWDLACNLLLTTEEGWDRILEAVSNTAFDAVLVLGDGT
jgi:hypothetical protein